MTSRADFGATDVRRDMELVRKILEKVSDKMDLEPEFIQIEGVNDLIMLRHNEMIYEEGLVQGNDIYTTGSDPCKRIFISDLSWEGHEFLGAIKDKDLWEQLKKAIGPDKLAGMPLKAIKDAAIQISTNFMVGAVKSHLGL